MSPAGAVTAARPGTVSPPDPRGPVLSRTGPPAWFAWSVPAGPASRGPRTWAAGQDRSCALSGSRLAPSLGATAVMVSRTGGTAGRRLGPGWAGWGAAWPGEGTRSACGGGPDHPGEQFVRADQRDRGPRCRGGAGQAVGPALGHV